MLCVVDEESLHTMGVILGLLGVNRIVGVGHGKHAAGTRRIGQGGEISRWAGGQGNVNRMKIVRRFR